ncbi:MAG TPA: CPBP family intramembrane metalloprotease [Candidatus Pelethocola excrementipullorum]|nr:CPBP family intramembrane metalloprotease [Candidatus Pelethocola excrementipullorum]
MRVLFFDSKNRVRTGYLLILALAVMILASVAAGFGSAVFVKNEVMGEIIYSILYGGITLLLALFLFRKLYTYQKNDDMDCFQLKKESFLYLGAGLLVGLVLFTAVVVPLYLTGQYKIELTGAAFLPIFLNFIFFVSVGITEEVATRGLMQHALMRFGKWPALILISVVFGLLHMANEGVTVNAILGVTFAGFMLGMAMYATNSIMFAIGIHITWNWVQGAVYGIPVSGMLSQAHIFKTTFLGNNSLVTGGEFGAEASLSCLIVLVLISVAFYLYGKKKGRF